MSFIRFSDKIGNKKSRFYFWHDVSDNLGFAFKEDKDSYDCFVGRCHLIKPEEAKVLMGIIEDYLNILKRKEGNQWCNSVDFRITTTEAKDDAGKSFLNY